MLLRRTFFAAIVAALFALAPARVGAQSVEVFASGLEAPTKIVATGKGNLLVAEGGHGANTGRISIVDPTGVRRTLVDGLPSAFNLTAEGSPSGPSGIAIRGNTVYVSIADGDVLIFFSVLVGITTTRSISRPNWSATSCRIFTFTPCPISVAPVDTCTVPSV